MLYFNPWQIGRQINVDWRGVQRVIQLSIDSFYVRKGYIDTPVYCIVDPVNARQQNILTLFVKVILGGSLIR